MVCDRERSPESHRNLQPIPPGSVEYDIGFSTLIFRLDADCYALWTAEMLRTSTKSQTA